MARGRAAHSPHAPGAGGTHRPSALGEARDPVERRADEAVPAPSFDAAPAAVFAYAVARREDLEAFVFSTRLTRITRLLRQRDVDKVLDSVTKGVHDFSGGTRIGTALGDFNRKWARRVLGHGAVVIIVSDGWDRGDPAQLAAELDHLHRSAHRLIWLNPLIGSEGYEPLTRGMAAALPYCDDFLAAHNVQALDDLGRLLAGLGRRPAYK